MEAYLFEKQKNMSVLCNLCNHRCRIKNGRRGICNVRENNNGALESLVYGRLIAINVDPIEKKPFYHIMPGSLSYSIATVGCNFGCRFCQNADIAQMPNDHAGRIIGDMTSPQDVVAAAVSRGCESIAYTYTEPTIFFEFAYDTAKIAHAEGIKNLFVTNGYMTPEAIEMIAPYLDGANVDLKAYSNTYYKDFCAAKLEPVKTTLKALLAAGVWVEVTTLLVPGLNDSRSELEALSDFLANELGPDTPWHISRFHPTYKLTDRKATPLEALILAREIGIAAGLKYVYTGNVPGERSANTFCYNCGKLLINRAGFSVAFNQIKNGACPDCRQEIVGIGL
jgi:pyruvate formate lyase activating enzyme